jgi:hypothetical protein
MKSPQNTPRHMPKMEVKQHSKQKPRWQKLPSADGDGILIKSWRLYGDCTVLTRGCRPPSCPGLENGEVL